MFYDEWDLENGHEHDLSIALAAEAAAATSDGFRHNRRNPKKSFLTYSKFEIQIAYPRMHKQFTY